ncbi:hypothetical protein N9C31_03680 [Gammaproteobacteria bacterium]|nr:hypothetical protein [Gammaproteobacteria bacterium]
MRTPENSPRPPIRRRLNNHYDSPQDILGLSLFSRPALNAQDDGMRDLHEYLSTPIVTPENSPSSSENGSPGWSEDGSSSAEEDSILNGTSQSISLFSDPAPQTVSFPARNGVNEMHLLPPSTSASPHA